ncbi:MAG: caspase family protein [Deltaproteobacteria bacterium]|nr:caspase family protein [Deltaproteobacteria bacterium]
MLDSCFSGAGGRSVIAKGARPLVMKTESLALKDNIVMMTATRAAQISMSSPEKGHGLFTYHFLKALKDGKKNVADIYGQLKPLVEDDAKELNAEQSPSMTPAPDAAKGRFVLVR